MLRMAEFTGCGSQFQDEGVKSSVELNEICLDAHEEEKTLDFHSCNEAFLNKLMDASCTRHRFMLEKFKESIRVPLRREPLKADQRSLIDLDNQVLHEHDDFFLASQHPSASTQPLGLEQKDQPRSKLQRLKRGIPGFVNGKRIAAFPDTGSAQNVVSAAFVKERGLHVRETEKAFKLGNSKITKSTGIVDLVWAFAEDPAKAAKIVCHVLPTCQYDIILGHQFLKASETMTKFRRRITECMFTMMNVLHFNLLGSSQEYIRGSFGKNAGIFEIQALAALDTGAEGNIMSLDYALRQGFHIYNQTRNRKTILYTDGSYDETVGMVETLWTFESGHEITVTFEVVKDCIQDVVFGEEIAYDVYATQAGLIAQSFVEDASWRLATFSFVNKWQNALRNMNFFRKRTKENEGPGPRTLGTMKHEEWQERRRRDLWNYRYGFDGVKATEAELTAEMQLRRLYDAAYGALPTRPPDRLAP